MAESDKMVVAGQAGGGMAVAQPKGALASGRSILPTPEEWKVISDICKVIAASGLGHDDLRGSPEKIMTVALKGWELGLSIMQALDGIDVIKGRPTIAADLLSALAQQRVPGAEIWWVKDGTAGVATVTCKRQGRPDVTLSFSHDDAVEAGLTRKDVWLAWEPDMLRATVLRKACKMQYPEVGFGFDVAERAAATLEEHPGPSAPNGSAPAHSPPPHKATAEPKPSEPAAAAKAPPDANLGFTDGPFAGKSYSNLTPDEIKRLIKGYDDWLANAPTDADSAEKVKSRTARRDMARAWLSYREGAGR
jgi:hypothetical protein